MDLLPQPEVPNSEPLPAGHHVGTGQAEPQLGLGQDQKG